MRNLFNTTGRFIFIMLRPLFWLYFRLSKQTRVRLIITNNSDQILLVRGWIKGQEWDLPGGGIKRNEKPEQAASRELSEETGVTVLTRNFRPIDTFIHSDATTPFRVVLMSGKSDYSGKLQPRRKTEIIEAAWWPINDLPKRLNSIVESSLNRAGLV